MRVFKDSFREITNETAIEDLINYAKQNPEKYKMKKEALFKMYGLSEDTEIQEAIKKEVEFESDDIKELKKKRK